MGSWPPARQVGCRPSPGARGRRRDGLASASQKARTACREVSFMMLMPMSDMLLPLPVWLKAQRLWCPPSHTLGTHARLARSCRNFLAGFKPSTLRVYASRAYTCLPHLHPWCGLPRAIHLKSKVLQARAVAARTFRGQMFSVSFGSHLAGAARKCTWLHVLPLQHGQAPSLVVGFAAVRFRSTCTAAPA